MAQTPAEQAAEKRRQADDKRLQAGKADGRGDAKGAQILREAADTLDAEATRLEEMP